MCSNLDSISFISIPAGSMLFGVFAIAGTLIWSSSHAVAIGLFASAGLFGAVPLTGGLVIQRRLHLLKEKNSFLWNRFYTRDQDRKL